MVSSLVSLQSRALRDSAAKEALKETQGRIDAIASGHKSLYSSGDARFVDFMNICPACSITSKPRCATRGMARQSATTWRPSG